MAESKRNSSYTGNAIYRCGEQRSISVLGTARVVLTNTACLIRPSALLAVRGTTLRMTCTSAVYDLYIYIHRVQAYHTCQFVGSYSPRHIMSKRSKCLFAPTPYALLVCRFWAQSVQMFVPGHRFMCLVFLTSLVASPAVLCDNEKREYDLEFAR